MCKRRAPYPTAWPSVLNTNRWKPGIEMLKIHTMEKNWPFSRIEPRATGSLGRWCGAPSFHCCWPYTQSSRFTVLPCLYECIARIKPRTTGSLGGYCGAPSFQHPGLLLHCCWPCAQFFHFHVPIFTQPGLLPQAQIVGSQTCKYWKSPMEKNCPSSGIGPRATGSLGGCFGAPSF